MIGIGNYAFSDCTGLTSIAIPNSVNSIGNGAFMWCSGLIAVTIGNSVTSIGRDAFKNCTGLTSVTFPNSVTSIGSNAFSGCHGLTSITIPDSVTSIGESAFRFCNGLISVSIGNSVTSIGEDAFFCCSGLTSVTIPASVTSIGISPFYGCTGLTSIVVEAGNTHYDSRDNCNAIIQTDINLLLQGCNTTVIPSNVSGIGSYAFSECTGLTLVTIPDSVTSIGNFAFSGCNGLTLVTIPASVTSIGVSAFNGCSSLTSVYCKSAVPPTLANIAFGDTSYDCQFYVPCTSVNAYQSAANWGNYSSRIHGTPYIDFTYNFVSNNDTMGIVSIGVMDCDSNVTVTATANSGYHFVGWSDGGTGSPRTFHVTSDTTVAALFEINTYQLTVLSNDVSMGIVTGSGNYIQGSHATINVYPAAGYSFSHWSDGDTANPRVIQMTQDVLLIATFVKKETYPQITLTNDFIGTTINGRYFIPDGTACPDYPLNVPIYISNFSGYDTIASADEILSVCVNLEHSFMGDISISVVCPTGQEAFLKYGNIVQNNSGITVDSVTQSIISLTGGNGGGRNLGCPLDDWIGGRLISPDKVDNEPKCDSLQNPYGIGLDYCFSRDTHYTLVTGDNAAAVWSADNPHPSNGNWYITRQGNEISMTDPFDPIPAGFIHAGETPTGTFNTQKPSNHMGKSDYYLPVTTFEELVGCPVQGVWNLRVYDTWGADNGWVFGWSIDLKNMVFTSDTVLVHDTTYIDVPYAVHDTTYITLTDTVTNTVYDTIDNYIYDTTIVHDTTLVTDTLWMTHYDTVFVHDTIFIHDTVVVGVGDVDALNAKVYVNNGQIVVEGTEGNTVWLYDAVGRLLATKQNDYSTLRFDVPTTGTYLIKVGDHPARRVVVIR